VTDIELVTEPVVVVVGRPAFDRMAFNRYLDAVGAPPACPGVTNEDGDGEALVESGGRTCYRSWGRGRPHAEHVRHLIEVGHGSVLESAVYVLQIAGISRRCSHELIRHRAGFAVSQESQRYVDAKDVRFVVPPLLLRLADTHPARMVWEAACGQAAADYATVRDYLAAYGTPRKQANEAAASVLPGSAETRLQLAGNLRAWRNLVEQRCSPHADAEIRRLACRVLDALAPEAPNCFQDYRRVPLPDGTFAVETPHRKV
jgi:thymidylate synthase (FAD)